MVAAAIGVAAAHRVAAVDLGIKADDPAPHGRARLPGARAAGDAPPRTRSWPPARTGCSSPTGRATRPPPTTRWRRSAACSPRASRCSASASATRSSAGPSASAPTSCGSGTAGSTSRSQDLAHRPGADHRAQPRLRGATPPVRRAPVRHRRSAGSEVSHVNLNDGVVEGLRLPGPPGVRRAVPPGGGGRPARRRRTCSTGSRS